MVKMAAMLGWFNPAGACASILKRSFCPGSAATWPAATLNLLETFITNESIIYF